VVDVHVPALRDRKDDILALARILLADAALRMKRKMTGMTSATSDQLLRYSWPGNVRELENAMERAVALARGSRVELEDLPEEVRQALPKAVDHRRPRAPPRGRRRRSTSWRRSRRTAATRRTRPDQLGIGSATLSASSRATGSSVIRPKAKMPEYSETRTPAPSVGSKSMSLAGRRSPFTRRRYSPRNSPMKYPSME
jgi:DNA-binding NtrC family response regulator